jgi:hypothetical protein
MNIKLSIFARDRFWGRVGRSGQISARRWLVPSSSPPITVPVTVFNSVSFQFEVVAEPHLSSAKVESEEPR